MQATDNRLQDQRFQDRQCRGFRSENFRLKMFLYEFLNTWIASSMENPAERAAEAKKRLIGDRQLADQMYAVALFSRDPLCQPQLSDVSTLLQEDYMESAHKDIRVLDER